MLPSTHKPLLKSKKNGIQGAGCQVATLVHRRPRIMGSLEKPQHLQRLQRHPLRDFLPIVVSLHRVALECKRHHLYFSLSSLSVHRLRLLKSGGKYVAS